MRECFSDDEKQTLEEKQARLIIMTNTCDTIFVLDNDTPFEAELKQLLASEKLPCRIFTETSDFLDAFNPTWSGLLLLELRLPRIDGLEVQRLLNERGNQMPVIIITAHADVPMTIRAMKQGAFDLIQKPCDKGELLRIIKNALSLANENRKKYHKKQKLLQRLQRLSPRERQVLEKIISGGLNKTIADDLNISIKTVEYHRARLMAKMRVHSATDLMRTIYRAFPEGKLPRVK
ncbi:MAG: response regulator transcription factor [Magnetococcales bacterium]|nr:response regulator transcription factor [Magnetococcales bacterium]